MTKEALDMEQIHIRAGRWYNNLSKYEKGLVREFLDLHKFKNPSGSLTYAYLHVSRHDFVQP